jgi:hypothetical protein
MIFRGLLLGQNELLNGAEISRAESGEVEPGGGVMEQLAIFLSLSPSYRPSLFDNNKKEKGKHGGLPLQVADHRRVAGITPYLAFYFIRISLPVSIDPPAVI